MQKLDLDLLLLDRGHAGGQHPQAGTLFTKYTSGKDVLATAYDLAYRRPKHGQATSVESDFEPRPTLPEAETPGHRDLESGENHIFI
ncbi:hypothetical protein AVEN_185328-1 [Araneus ventricosus]|uniref:Uncharacterized protein n=1 Tax=Araneus ventricosus TaxID=182803 RepID=A0A4Y2R476_ARAVE|nr:hypothetical protein AVEN_185328-1 [Araneus ventricosus]